MNVRRKKAMPSPRKPADRLLLALVYTSAALTFLSLFTIVSYILIRGLGHFSVDLFAPVYTTANVSMLPSIITSIQMTGLALMISAPLGIFTGIYLVEYAKRGNKIVEIVRVMAETLAGIPSIVYGLFGMLFFVLFLGWGLSIRSGVLTISIMILPLIMRTTEEALKSVPDSYREGSYGLGAGKLRTVFKIVLPSSAPGILAGVILATGRIIGETAALLFTAGSVPRIATSVEQSARTLAIHMYALSSEGLNINEAHATAVVLLITVILLNAFSTFIASKVYSKQNI